MKKSYLRQIIKEEISKVLKEFNIHDMPGRDPGYLSGVIGRQPEDINKPRSITYYAKELAKMMTPGDEQGVQGLLYYILDNPEEMPESWNEDFVRDNFDEITDEAEFI